MTGFYDLAEIKGVSGLAEGELADLNALIATWWRKRPRNMLRNRYYESHSALKDLGISIPPPLRRIETYVEWPAKAVDYMASRCLLEGFTFDGTDGNDVLDQVMGDNDFLTLASQAVTDALVSSFSLLSVTKGGPGEPDVIVAAHSARDSAVIWDWRLKRPRCALVVADVRRDASGRVAGPSLVQMFGAAEVVTLGRRRNGRWVVEARQAHPQGQPLVEAIRYSPKLGRPLGKSRISRTVMSLTDSAVREALRCEVSAEFFTAPQKYIMGADDDVFGDKTKWEAYIGTWLVLTPNEEGENPSVGQLPQGTMQPHIDYERQLAARFAGATGVPMSSLGVIHDNPASAEAIYAAKEDVIIEAQGFNRDNASALKRVARLMMAVAQGKAVGELAPSELSVQPRFTTPAIPSIASQTDAVIKQVSAVPEFAGTRVFWEQLGYSPDQIARIQSDIKRAEAQRRVGELMAQPQQDKAATMYEVSSIIKDFRGDRITEADAMELFGRIGVAEAEARSILAADGGDGA